MQNSDLSNLTLQVTVAEINANFEYVLAAEAFLLPDFLSLLFRFLAFLCNFDFALNSQLMTCHPWSRRLHTVIRSKS